MSFYWSLGSYIKIYFPSSTKKSITRIKRNRKKNIERQQCILGRDINKSLSELGVIFTFINVRRNCQSQLFLSTLLLQLYTNHFTAKCPFTITCGTLGRWDRITTIILFERRSNLSVKCFYFTLFQYLEVVLGDYSL